LALSASLICGIADSSIIIVVTAIILTEFPDNADLYYAYVHIMWDVGYTLGPIVPFLAYESLGNAGVYFLTAGLVVVGALIPTIFFLPASLN
jgi:MFS family permease